VDRRDTDGLFREATALDLDDDLFLTELGRDLLGERNHLRSELTDACARQVQDDDLRALLVDDRSVTPARVEPALVEERRIGRADLLLADALYDLDDVGHRPARLRPDVEADEDAGSVDRLPARPAGGVLFEVVVTTFERHPPVRLERAAAPVWAAPRESSRVSGDCDVRASH